MTEQSLEVDKLLEFEKFEKKNEVFNLKFDQIPVWERIRKQIYDKVRFKNTNRSQDTGTKLVNILKRIYLMNRNIIMKNPYTSKNYDILVYGTGRRELEPNGKWWDIYFDPVYEGGLDNYIHLEPAHNASHYNPIQTNVFKYTDLIRYLSGVVMKFGLGSPSIPNNLRDELIKLEEQLEYKFNVKIDLRTMVHNELHSRRIKYVLYKQLINKIDPKILIIECSYGRETLIEVAKSLKIPVIELQHGIITDRHLGYSYRYAKKMMFPDYLFVWGDFWKDSAKIPLPDDRIISTGYPYLDQKKSDFSSINNDRKIVFISQETIGEKLSELAVALSQYSNFDYDIVYKLHPKEYENWGTRYPELVEANLKVIGSDGPGLYNLFTDSSIQIGVYSTALFEGVAFGLNTYIYDIPGWQQIKQLVEKGPAQTISSPEELASLIKNPSKESGENIQIFRDHGVKNTIKEINKIKNNGTTFNTLSNK